MITKDSQNFFSVKTSSVSGPLADADAIKTSIATDDTNASVYTDTELDGVIGDSTMVFGRTLSVTTSTSAATYNTTDPIIITGLDLNGNSQIEDLFLTQAGGNETVTGTLAFTSVTQIFVPIQDDNTGFFTFGVQDAILADQAREIRVATGGNLHVTYPDGTEDTIPALVDGEKLPIGPVKIWSDSTVEDITVLF